MPDADIALGVVLSLCCGFALMDATGVAQDDAAQCVGE
jgi:hypothetical protein